MESKENVREENAALLFPRVERADHRPPSNIYLEYMLKLRIVNPFDAATHLYRLTDSTPFSNACICMKY
jgi:hypothetical protein